MTAALRTWCCSAAVSPVSRLHGAAPPPSLPPCSQPHINLVFAAELSYVQLLDCSAAVLQCCRRGWGRPLHCLRVCRASPVYSAWKMSGRLALVHLAACSAPCCSAAVLQTKHAVPGLAHLSDSLIPSSRGCTLHNRVLLNTAIPAAQRQSCRPNIIQVHVSPHFSVHFCLPHLLSSQSTRHLPALSARCTDFTQAARRRRGSNQAAIGDLNAAAASHVQCCS